MQVLDTGSRWSGATDGARSFMRADVPDRDALVLRLDASQRSASARRSAGFCPWSQRQTVQVWEHDGAGDMCHWLRMRYGISDWKARRWIAASHALESLPSDL